MHMLSAMERTDRVNGP